MGTAETVTLSQARTLITALAHSQSLLLLSAPGVGKSDLVQQAAAAAGLECRSLLGTQIAPEDVSGVPRIVGERSVFCPPRVLLPEDPEPFCLFLDELPATSPDVQKAFYSLLLERRIGEYRLPEGTWVVAAGNRVQDRALVRAMSSALVNRVAIINVRVDNREWLQWAQDNGVRADVLAFIAFQPQALSRDVPAEPLPFSTPRAWVSLSAALDLVEAHGELDDSLRRALAFGRVSAQDAALYCAMAEQRIEHIAPLGEYLTGRAALPTADSALWFVLHWIRKSVEAYGSTHDTNGLNAIELADVTADDINTFLMSLPEEHRFALLVGLVGVWGSLGAEPAMFESLAHVTGLTR